MLLNPRSLNGREYEMRNSCRRHPEASDIRLLEQRGRKIVSGELINILYFYWVGTGLILDYLTSYS